MGSAPVVTCPSTDRRSGTTASEAGEGLLEPLGVGGGSEHHQLQLRSRKKARGVWISWLPILCHEWKRALIPTLQPRPHRLDLQRQSAARLQQPSLEPQHRVLTDQGLELALQLLAAPTPLTPHHQRMNCGVVMVVMLVTGAFVIGAFVVGAVVVVRSTAEIVPEIVVLVGR